MTSHIESKLSSSSAPLGRSPSITVLQNIHRETPTGQLSAPGDMNDARRFEWPAFLVRRYPLAYDPSSTTRVNAQRLPDLRQLSGMDLAFREQEHSSRSLAAAVAGRLHHLFLFLLILTLALVYLAGAVRLEPALLSVPTVTLVWVIVLAITRRVSLRNIFIAVVAPVAVVILLKAASVVFSHRLVGSSVFGAAALVAAVAFGRRPFRFYGEWLHTHPRLRPASRRDVPPGPAPDFTLLAIVLGIAIVVPSFSTLLALLAIAVSCLVWARRTLPLREGVNAAQHVLATCTTASDRPLRLACGFRPLRPIAASGPSWPH